MTGDVAIGAFQWVPAQTPLVVLADGCFGEPQSKLALGVIRYGEWPIAAVIDSSRAGKTVKEVTGLPCDAPIVGSLEQALAFHPKALLIGTAPPGGRMPEEWRSILADAIQSGIHIINGLHFFLQDEPDLVKLAQQFRVQLWDVRNPEGYGRHKFQEINLQKDRPKNTHVITMVGSDCSVGKMHTALELYGIAKQRGHAAGFVATGQTGILIAGRGVPLDRVIGDFMAGAMEICIHEELRHLETLCPNGSEQPRFLFVEGQGSLLHPAYSGVTLSLLHGSNPDSMILCHKAESESIKHYPQIPLPSMRELIAMYESAASWARPKGQPKARVVGISMNSSILPEPEARRYLDQLADETGLPVTDPVRYGVDSLLQALKLEPVASI